MFFPILISDDHSKARRKSPRLSIVNMMAALFILLLPFTAFGAGGDKLWQFADSLPGKQEARSSAVDSSGNVVVTGYQNLAGGVDDDYFTVKFKADGSGIAWRATYDRAHGSDQATSVVIDSENNVIVTGHSWNGTNYDIHTIKYSGATGNLLWQHTYNGAANGHDVGTSLAVDSLNNIYVGGYSQNSSGNEDYITLKYSATGPNPDGKPAWVVTAHGTAAGANKIASVATGGDGVAVTGQSWNGTAFNILTVKYDFNGSKLWERTYSTGAANPCSGAYVKMNPGGDVFITGAASNGLDLDIYTARYNGATGAIIWQRTFNGAFDDEPSGLAIGPEGNVYLTGYTWTMAAQNDFYTAKYDAGTGAVIWEKNFNSNNGNDDIASPTGIVIDPLGDLFVTGFTVADKNYDFQTIKYKKDNGTLLWNSRLNGAANLNDRPAGIGLSPSGEVMVAGWSDSGANSQDLLVVKYDPGLLDPPTSLTAQAATNSSANLSWVDNSGNEDGFSIERCANQGCTDFAEIATTAAGVTSHTDSGLTPGSYYSYRVRAVSGSSGYSHYSNVATALTVVVNFSAPAATFLYNGVANKDEFANAIAVGPDNNPVIAGQSNDYPAGYSSGDTSFDYLLIKLNRSGMNALWSDRYNDPTDASDIATCVAVDRNNSIVVSGYATLHNGTSSDVNSLYTMRYPASGPPALSADQYNGPIPGGATDDRAIAVAIASASDSSNNVVVVGYGKNAASNDDIYVIKYNPDGSRAWVATPFDGNQGDDFPTTVILATDGSVFVAGYSETGANTNIHRYFVSKYNGATGARIWTDLSSIVPGGDSRFNSLALDSAGDLYVTGFAINASGNKDFYTVKYSGTSATAQQLWTRQFDGSAHGDDEAVAVRIDPVDDAVVVSGTVFSGSEDRDLALVKYSFSGDPIWSKVYQRPTSDDVAKAMGIDSNGNIYLAGNTGNGLTTDSLTVKFDSLGNITAATVFNGAANSYDESTALVINSLDEVFVAGYSENASGSADALVYKILPDSSQPSVPASLSAVPGYANVALSWANVATAKDGFQVERKLGVCSATNSNVWVPLASVPAATLTYNDTGLNPGATYCYQVRTYLAAGGVSRWRGVQATTLVPATPAGVAATVVNTTKVNLSWSDNTSGETGFRIERCSGAACSDFTQVGTASANATSYADSSVCNGTSYLYRVLAYGSGWESSAGALASLVTTPTAAAPVLAAARISEVEIDLSWNDPNSDETAYLVERCSGVGCSNFEPVTTLAPNSTQFKNTGLSGNSSYSYRIKAYKTDSCSWETYSNTASATTDINPPSGLAASASSSTGINLSWTDNTVSETGFTVEKCVGSGCVIFNQLANTASNAVSYLDNSACAGETATYRVKATREAVTLSNGNGGCWTRRVPLTVSNFQPNFQMRLTVPYDSDMLGSFADLRFLDNNANLELPYWIEDKVDGTSATVWIKAGSNSSISMYFGNAVAQSSSNGPAVFEFFDEFTGASLDSAKWQATGAYSLSSGALRIDTGAVYSGSTIASTPQNRVFEMKSQWLGATALSSGLSIANAQSAQPNNAGSNSLISFVTDSGATANLLAYGANGATASYNIASGTQTSTISTGTALYNPFLSNGQNTRVPASGVWSPPGGGDITRIHVVSQSETNYDYFYVYNAAGTLLGTYNGTVNQWVDIAATSGLYTVFRTDGSVQSGVGGNVTEVVVSGISPVNALNSYRIVGYEFRNTSDISYFVKETNYSEVVRKSYTGTWNVPSYLWLGYLTGAAAGTTDGDDMLVDWVRVRKYAATEPVVAFGSKESASCFTFASPWEGAYSNSASATALTPTSPVLNATRANEGGINLSWSDNNSDRSGFRLWRCAGSGCSDFSQIGGTLTATSYSDSGLLPNTQYSYYLETFKTASCGWSRPSGQASATTTLLEPNGLTATANNSTQITISWVDRTGFETGFKVYRCLGSGCSDFSQIGTAAANATSYSDTTVAENSTYRYQIQATSSTLGWDSLPSAAVEKATPAAASPTLAAVNRVSEVQLQITWSDSNTDRTGFRLFRCIGSGCSDFSQVGGVLSTTSYSDAGLTPGTSYSYYVESFKTATNGWVKQSGRLSAVTTLLEPGSLAAAVAGTTQVNLSWTRTTGSETGFSVERCSGTGCSNFAQISVAAASSTGYSDNSVCSGLSYSYRVKAINSTVPWESGYSNVATTVTSAITNLLADSSFENSVSGWPTAVGTLTGTSIDTTTVFEGAKGLKLTATGAQLGRAQVVAVTPGRQYQLSGYLNTALTAGTAQCDVSGTGIDSPGIAIAYDSPNNNSGWLPLSETVQIPVGTTSVTIRCFANGTPQGTASFDAITFAPADFVLTATRANEKQINLTWLDSVVDETGYRIERCTGSSCSDFSQITTTGPNATSYSDGSVAANTTYTYRVRGYKTATCGWEGSSSTTSIATTTITAPGTLGATSPNTTTINLSWLDNTVSETGFKVERCSGAGCSDFVQLAVAAANATSYSDTSVASGTTYRYQVRATNGTLWDSDYSNIAGTTTASPTAPANLNAVRGSDETRMNLSWTDSTSDETGYKVERCSGEGCSSFVQIGSNLAANSASYNDTGLQGNTSYSYRVSAYKTATSSWSVSSMVSVTTTVAAPVVVAATATSTTSVNLTWTDTTGSESGFKIERCTGVGCSDFSQISLTAANATSYLDSSVAKETVYRYQVRATNATVPWDSGYSAIVTATTPKPLPPASLSAVRGTNETRMNLAWTDSTSDETGYKVERCAGVGCSDFAVVVSNLAANSASYIDTGLQGNTSYSYRVSAFKTATNSWSVGSEVTATTTLIAPASLAASAPNSQQVNLTWTDTSGSETGYKIERCTGTGCTFSGSEIATAAANATSYSDSTVTSGTTYQYRIRATNSSVPWDSGYSGTVVVTTPNQGTPSALATSFTGSKVTVTWTRNTVDETGFTIQRCTGSSCLDQDYSQIGQVGAGVTSYQDSTVCSNTTYSYRVSAYRTSYYTTPYSSAVSVTPAPSLPVLTVTRSSEAQLSLTWTDSNLDKNGFRVERCIGSGCSDFAVVADNLATTVLAYSDSGLFPNFTYNYRVRSFNNTASCGWELPSAAKSQVTTVSAPGSLTATAAGTGQINLAWSDTTATETGFRIERCSGSGCSIFGEIGSAAAGATSWSDTGLTPGTSHSYRVRATKATSYAWDSGYSNTASVSTQTAPAAPSGLTAQAVSSGLINLTWNDASTPDGYYIESCSGSGCASFSQIASVAVSPKSYANVGLTASTTYCYRVRGFKTGVWTTGYSATACATTLIDSPATLTATAMNSQMVRLTWTDGTADVNGFNLETQLWNGEWAVVASLGADATSYIDTVSIEPLKTYNYRIRSFAGAQYSGYSNLTAVTMPAYLPSDGTCVVADTSAPTITSTPVTTAVEGAAYSYQVTATAVGARTISYTLARRPSGMSITAAGLVSWTPQYNQSGNQNVTIRVIDSEGHLAEQHYAINVANLNRGPAISSTPVTTAVELHPYSYQVVATDLEGDNLAYSLATAPAGMNISAVGLVTWIPTTGQYGPNPVAIRVSDGTFTAEQNFSISVGHNQPPVISSAPVTGATDGAAYSYQVVASDADGDALTYSLVTAPAGMTISLNGLVNWTPTKAQADTGNHQVSVLVSDGSLTTAQEFTIVVAANHTPIILSTPPTTASEGAVYSYSVAANNPVVGDTLSYALQTAPAGMTISPAGVISWTPATGQGDTAVPVTVAVQAGGATATQSFTIAAPFIVAPATQRASVGTAYSLPVSANAVGRTGTIVYSLSAYPAGMTINTATGVISWTPTAGQTGSNSVTVKATIGAYTPALYATRTFTVAVPAITSPAVTIAAVGKPYSYGVTASDPAGGTFSYALTTAPTGMTINASTGGISWTPAANQGGNSAVTVVATVNGTAPVIAASQSFTVSVASITSSPVTTASVGVTYSYQVTATGTSLVYSLDSSPAGMSINTTTGLINWTPTAAGSTVVTVRVTSGGAAFVTQAFTITAHTPPAAPTGLLTNPSSIDTGCGGSVAVSLSWNPVAGPDGHSVQYAVILNGAQQAWQAGTGYIYNATGSQNWYVKTRDAVTLAESLFSLPGTLTDFQTCVSPSSCPLVYSWDGTRYSYETDLQGPAISQIKKGARYVNLYQPSYIVLGALAADENNKYRVKIWESLQESTLMDEAKLLAVDYPTGYEIVSSGAENTYYYAYVNPFKIYTVKDPVLPVSATDKYGTDILASVQQVDNSTAPMNPNDPDNSYTFDFGTIAHPEYAKLVIDGWQIINSKLFLSTQMIQPYIEVVDPNGAWVKVQSFGMPMGDLKTMVIDLGNKFLSADHRVRLHLGIKKAQVWVVDRVRLDDSAPVNVTVQELQPDSADLQLAGGDAIAEMNTLQHRIMVGDGSAPLNAGYYGYGNFTRLGEVRELLTQRDDKYVIMNYGDKMELAFPALPSPQPGNTRGFILKADLYYKDFKDYKYVEPLPFHGMSDYPYPATESYPTDDDHNQYRLQYNTRQVSAP
ncbi:DUF2341 domain-containing protein [Geobacter pelophilus]|uniref:DUF2341 domain-containing protein n=1 Tax=Geoanaerobacter pelophilus TaxID=60036 RepID=A0AAW4L439_9BACT|nr:DUF2341 domain-containing protein [Geoanaerobacter pelophilus]MBT0664575.1 DUF2341 domain-containing protein [Geoanaerobacter pelophilus]